MPPQRSLAHCQPTLLDDLTFRVKNHQVAEPVPQIQTHRQAVSLAKLPHGRSPFWASSPSNAAFLQGLRGGRPSHPISLRSGDYPRCERLEGDGRIDLPPSVRSADIIYVHDPSFLQAPKKFMELAVSEAKRARDRGDYPIGAVITGLTRAGEVVIASAGNRVKTSGSSIKHVELETLKYVSSGYGRYLPDFVLYSSTSPAPCARAHACGPGLAPSCTASPRKTSPTMVARAQVKTTSGERVSSPAGSFSRRAITRSRSLAAIFERNAGSCSVTGPLAAGRIRRRRVPEPVCPHLVPWPPATVRWLSSSVRDAVGRARRSEGP